MIALQLPAGNITRLRISLEEPIELAEGEYNCNSYGVW